MSKDKFSVEGLFERDRDYRKAMEKGSKGLLLALWDKHAKQLEYASECGRKVVRP